MIIIIYYNILFSVVCFRRDSVSKRSRTKSARCVPVYAYSLLTIGSYKNFNLYTIYYTNVRSIIYLVYYIRTRRVYGIYFRAAESKKISITTCTDTGVTVSPKTFAPGLVCYRDRSIVRRRQYRNNITT